MNTLHLLCLVVLSLALLGSYVCSSEPQQYYGDADDISEPTEEQVRLSLDFTFLEMKYDSIQ